MNTLINFSVKRRFINKASFMFYLMTIIILGVLVNFDHVINIVSGGEIKNVRVRLENIDVNRFLVGHEHLITQDEKSEVSIVDKNDSFHIIAPFELSIIEEMTFKNMIIRYANSEMAINVIPIEVHNTANKTLSNDSIFGIISSAYFMILSFATMVINEMIVERTSNILEMLVSVISIRKYFKAKIIVGIVMMFIQLLLNAGILFIWLLIRNVSDGGKGLLEILKQNRIISTSATTFVDYMTSGFFSYELITKLVFSFLFLLLGIITIQIILITMSCKISSIEESGNMQAPLYIVLIVMYYGAIVLNTREHMINGIGTIFSLIPILNALIMPIRIVVYNYVGFDILIGILISGAVIYGTYYHGVIYFENNVSRGKRRLP